MYDQFGKGGLNGDNPQAGEGDFSSSSGGPGQATMSREEADKIFQTIFGGGNPFASMFEHGQGGGTHFVFRTAGPDSGPSGFRSFDSTSNGLDGMHFSNVFGGNFPGARARTAGSRDRSRSSAGRMQRLYLVPNGAPIIIQGLTKSFGHNGKLGH